MESVLYQAATRREDLLRNFYRIGRRAVLLAQSYMPAQDIHVLRKPEAPDNPWYIIEGDGPLATPEWDFPAGSLRRFSEAGCPKKH